MEKVTVMMESEASGGPKHKRETSTEDTTSKSEHERKSSTELASSSKVARWMDTGKIDTEGPEGREASGPMG